jgi:hypothetical protein
MRWHSDQLYYLLPMVKMYGGIRRIALLGITLAAASGYATTYTFAQFQEAGTGGNLFQFVNNADTSGLLQSWDSGTSSTSIPINFSYQPSFITGTLSNSLQGVQQAHLVLNAPTDTPVGYFSGTDFQPLLDSGALTYSSIAITRDAPLGGLTNLLTVNFISYAGSLNGHEKGQTASFTADNTLSDTSGNFDIVIFTSDFLSFGPVSQNDLSLSFTSVTPCFTLHANASTVNNNCVVSGGTMNYLHNLAMAGTGSFASNPEPSTAPEPYTLLSGSLGVAALLIARRRKARC